jgi:NAD(P)H-dependent flavin oxidoreductase YrpB (nitropropane dioxygenase family)
VHAALSTPLFRTLGSRYPVIQTAMGWVSRPELVAASCNAGAFGFLAAATLRADEVGPAIDAVRARTDQPFGVNFHMFQPGAAQIVETICAKRVRAVSFGRGPDKAAIKRFRDAGVLCIPTIGAVRHAQKMIELGVDAVTVQGGEGGGHTGSVATTVLLPQVLDAVKVPVVAAGGFSDGRGLAAALAFGAQGIAMGTRFLMTQECPVPEATKGRYVSAKTDDIVVTTRIDGIPQRMIRNEVLARLENATGASLLLSALGNALAVRRMTGASIGDLMHAARGMMKEQGLSFAQALMAANAPALLERSMIQGRPADGVMATGQIAGALNDLPTCAQLLERIIREADERIAALSGAAATDDAAYAARG